MGINSELGFLLQRVARERTRKDNEFRAYNLESTVIPNQVKIIEFNRSHGLATLADEHILNGLKREYKQLTGEEYRA